MNTRALAFLLAIIVAHFGCDTNTASDLAAARAVLSEKGPGAARPLILSLAESPPKAEDERVAVAELLIEIQEAARAVEILTASGELSARATDVLIYARLLTGERDEADILIAGLISTGKATARTRLLKGMLALARGERRNAEAEIRELMRIDDGDPVAHAWLGFVLLQKGRGEEADDVFRRALRRFPDSPEVRAGYATVILAEAEPGPGKWSKIVDLLTPAVRARPGDRVSRQHLGEALRRLGRLVEAENEFDALVEGWPEVPAYWSGLGTIRMAREEFKKAQDAFERAAKLAPTSIPIQLNLGAAYLELVRFSHDRAAMVARARDVFLEVKRLDPTNPLVYVGLARAAVKLDPESDANVRAAMAHYDHALELDPDCHQAHLNLALLYYDVWGEGEGYRKAKLHFDLAKKSGPAPGEWDRAARDTYRMLTETLGPGEGGGGGPPK